MLRTSCKSDSPPSINEAPHSKCTFLQKKRTLLHLLTAEIGTTRKSSAAQRIRQVLEVYFCRRGGPGGMFRQLSGLTDARQRDREDR